MLSDPLIVVGKLARVFDGLGVAYLVGGSLASSLYGIPRATQDVGLVAGLGFPQVEPVTHALENDFYVDAVSISDAIRQRGSFNVIHLGTMFKADIFIPREGAWPSEEMLRARSMRFEVAEETMNVRFSSPEDTILHKLQWYRLGGHISDRQWSDVLGVIKIQGRSLDLPYLERWAAALNLAELLVRAKQEA